MPILVLLVWFALIGLVAYLLIRFIPMTPGVQTVIKVAAVILCVLILISALGIGLNSGPLVPRIR